MILRHLAGIVKPLQDMRKEQKRQSTDQEQGQQEPTSAAGKAAPAPEQARPSEKTRTPITPTTIMHATAKHNTTSDRNFSVC